MSDGQQWRRCSACKRAIELGATYWVCNVSTCNRKRTGLVFCTVSCWEVHLPTANHRESWALVRSAPQTLESEEAPAKAAAPTGGRRRIARPDGRSIRPSGERAAAAEPVGEVLIVASRLKDYVRERSGFNTSDRVLEPLSKIVRRVCDEAIRNAVRDGRKTVLDRDIPRG